MHNYYTWATIKVIKKKTKEVFFKKKKKKVDFVLILTIKQVEVNAGVD